MTQCNEYKAEKIVTLQNGERVKVIVTVADTEEKQVQNKPEVAKTLLRNMEALLKDMERAIPPTLENLCEDCNCDWYDGSGCCHPKFEHFPWKPRKKKCKYYVVHDNREDEFYPEEEQDDFDPGDPEGID